MSATDQQIPANDFERDNCMHCKAHKPDDSMGGSSMGWWSCYDWYAVVVDQFDWEPDSVTDAIYRDALNRPMCHKAKPPEHEGQLTMPGVGG